VRVQTNDERGKKKKKTVDAIRKGEKRKKKKRACSPSFRRMRKGGGGGWRENPGASLTNEEREKKEFVLDALCAKKKKERENGLRPSVSATKREEGGQACLSFHGKKKGGGCREGKGHRISKHDLRREKDKPKRKKENGFPQAREGWPPHGEKEKE